MRLLQKIVSGGQTGADRAALDWAIANGIAYGGWCPRGRQAEDGEIDARYALVETPSKSYGQRTKWNVRDSEATLIVSRNPGLTGGSLKTEDYARLLGKPCLHICEISDAATKLNDFLTAHEVRVLNVAGSRESSSPGIGTIVKAVLDACRAELRHPGSTALDQD